jgi:hypothetical protein
LEDKVAQLTLELLVPMLLAWRPRMAVVLCMRLVNLDFMSFYININW